ncbi:MAG: hypothetical protein VXY23_09480 [Pseudomonadota bacterium]|nr:hypothetical protein [Pseudomonadota bacterium]
MSPTENENHRPIISYCVTCMNRGEQLKKTLEYNLEIIREYSGQVELCLVNFIKDAEGEAIHNWLKGLAGREGFRYFFSRNLTVWHASVAKNTAHMQGAGCFLVNLDCDNYLSRGLVDGLLGLPDDVRDNTVFSGFTGGFREEITKHKSKSVRLRQALAWLLACLKSRQPGVRGVKRKPVLLRSVRQGSDRHFNGTYGHIGLPATLFHYLGGYDESLPPMGGQDKNLLWRAYNIAGVTLTHIPVPQDCIPVENTKIESMKHTDLSSGWSQLQLEGTALTLNAIRDRRLIANNGCPGGVAVEKCK